MKSTKITLKNETGLHARPASQFVKNVQNSNSDIKVKKGNNTVNGKSLIAIMSLGVSQGDTIEIIAEGDDEKEAIKKLKETINNF